MYYRNRGNYHNNNRRYPNIQNVNLHPKNIPADLPPIQDNTLKKDIPPNPPETPIKDIPDSQSNQNGQNFLSGFFSQSNPITSLLNINASTLDKDKLIILALMYLLYKDGKKNLKLILALGYILI